MSRPLPCEDARCAAQQRSMVVARPGQAARASPRPGSPAAARPRRPGARHGLRHRRRGRRAAPRSVEVIVVTDDAAGAPHAWPALGVTIVAGRAGRGTQPCAASRCLSGRWRPGRGAVVGPARADARRPRGGSRGWPRRTPAASLPIRPRPGRRVLSRIVGRRAWSPQVRRRRRSGAPSTREQWISRRSRRLRYVTTSTRWPSSGTRWGSASARLPRHWSPALGRHLG